MVKKRLYLKLASWSQFIWFQFCWWHWKHDNKEPVEHMLPSPHEVWLGCWLWPHRCHQDSSQLVWSSAWTLACCCLLHCLADWPIGGTGWWHGGQACFSSSFHWGYLGCHQWLSVLNCCNLGRVWSFALGLWTPSSITLFAFKVSVLALGGAVASFVFGTFL